MKFFKLLCYCIAFSLLFSNCKKDLSSSQISSLDLEINEFIWGGLNTNYLWVDNVPKLSPTYFSNDQSKIINFLKGYSDHEKLFYDLLYDYGTVDRFSWIVSDYTALQQQFQGVTKSMGYDFQLYRIRNSENIFGFVHYVVPNSPAAKAGVVRGDIFIKVNGTALTVSNYVTLLSLDSYSLSFATIGNLAYDNSKTASMTSAVVQENPIYLDTIYTINNNIKVGYLVYNGFIGNYDNQLNQVFKHFKDNGIQKLILDLRYNPGGSGDAATYLASMIYSTDTTKVMYKISFNSLLEAYYTKKYGSEIFNNYFADSIQYSEGITSKEPINSLGLNDLYIIATHNSASASELVINSLRPQLQLTVTLIGDTTYGKYVGSETIYDRDSLGNINPNHKWALQPIIIKAMNINGFTDFNKGLIPDITKVEDLSNVLPFGDTNETLLKAALDKIQGFSQTKSFISNDFTKVASSKDLVPHSRELYFNNSKKIQTLNFSKTQMK